MERLKQRIEAAKRTWASLHELVILSKPTVVERDAAIQRFEYTFEAGWKAAKQYLIDIEGIDVASPKGVIRSLREVNLLSEEEAILGLNMVNDRNLTVHTYNEDLAIKIHSQLKLYSQLLKKIIDQLEHT